MNTPKDKSSENTLENIQEENNFASNLADSSEDFDCRLAEARLNLLGYQSKWHKTNPKNKKMRLPFSLNDAIVPNKNNVWAIYSRVAIELLSALAVTEFIGYWLDKLFHASPWFIIGFFPFGLTAGAFNVWKAFTFPPLLSKFPYKETAAESDKQNTSAYIDKNK